VPPFLKVKFFKFFPGNEMEYFSIDPATGNLFATKEMDREMLEKDAFMLEIEALQRDNPLKGATTKVRILVIDINDNWPQFEMSEFNKTINENLPNGEEIYTFTATDADMVIIINIFIVGTWYQTHTSKSKFVF
jgi:hypothetical protein